MAYATFEDMGTVVENIDEARAQRLLDMGASVINSYVQAGGGTVPVAAPVPNDVRIANIIIAHRVMSVGSPGKSIVQAAIDDYSYTTGGYRTVEEALTIDGTIRTLLADVVPDASARGMSQVVTL